MMTSTQTPKSAPVQSPIAKKPSLLMRLFSTERKSSLYVMPTNDDADDDGNNTASSGDKARQQKRQMKRLQSVDSATMQRDREKLLQERRHQQQQHRLANRTATSPLLGDVAPDKVSSKTETAVSSSPPKHLATPAKHSVDPVGQCSHPVRPSSANVGSGNGSSFSAASRRKQSMPAAIKLQINPKSTTATSPTTDTSPNSKTTKSPTVSDKLSSSASSPAAADFDAQPLSPASFGSIQKKPSQQSSPAKSNDKRTPAGSPETDVAKPPMSSTSPKTPSEGGALGVRQEIGSKKRPSMCNENSPPMIDQQQLPSRTKQSSSKSRKANRKLKHRKQRSQQSEIKVDTTKPLEFPTTPDIISEYHRQKPFLNRNEEWLIVELLEYECMVDSLDIIKIIAKHSKFFEVEPDELWEEFFEFVENVPSYDEIINYDVWQEFLLEKYNC